MPATIDTARAPRLIRRAAVFTLALASAGLTSGTASPATEPPPADLRAWAAAAPAEHRFDECRYRVIGKVRLVLFWAGRDDVGSGRMTAHRHGQSTTLAFLVGSDPQRAPKRLNEWSYLREEVTPTQADIFALRSLDRGQAVREDVNSSAEKQAFTVSCSSTTGEAMRTVHTTVNARGITYKMLDQFLAQIAEASQWKTRLLSLPDGAAPGFLTAMQQVIRTARTGPRAIKTMKTLTYVHNDTVYDLSLRGTDWLGRTRIGGQTFDRLIRTEFAVRSRTTGDVNRFGVTFSPDPGASPLPVQIFFQPSFWLRIELRLDDTADVPADARADQRVVERIRGICASAQ